MEGGIGGSQKVGRLQFELVRSDRDIPTEKVTLEKGLEGCQGLGQGKYWFIAFQAEEHQVKRHRWDGI